MVSHRDCPSDFFPPDDMEHHITIAPLQRTSTLKSQEIELRPNGRRLGRKACTKPAAQTNGPGGYIPKSLQKSVHHTKIKKKEGSYISLVSRLHRVIVVSGCSSDQPNEGIPYLQPLEDRLRGGGCCCGAKLSPNISLRTCPGSWRPISLATREALSLTCSRSSVLVQSRRATWSFLFLESSEMPHLVYRCSLSSAVSRFCICLASISRSRCSFLALHEAYHWIIISYSEKRRCDHGHQVIIQEILLTSQQGKSSSCLLLHC